MGFPTANLELKTDMLPPQGVYPAHVREIDLKRMKTSPDAENFHAEVKNKLWEGVLNFGVRPTFGSGAQPVLEVFLLDYSGDLYDKHLEVFFYPMIRKEVTFKSEEDLKVQIEQDVSQARTVLSTKKGLYKGC